ncbi:MAG: stage II sporulation protein P [Firmicutes bacterium]|nr:stage II sporulation protein P [Bacillota bacterium]
MSYGRAVQYHRRQLVVQKVRQYIYRLLAVVLVLVLWLNPYRPVVMDTFSVAAGRYLEIMSTWSNSTPKYLLNYAMPILAWNNQSDGGELASGIALAAFATVTKVNIDQPENILNSQIPLLADANQHNDIEKADKTDITFNEGTVAEQDEQAVIDSDDDMSKETEENNIALNGPPHVAIYNTHTGETYVLTDGMDRINGKRGGVVRVAEALQQQLQKKHQIKTVRSDEVHDAQYNLSYINSEKTVKQLIDQHKELKLVLDIHRDAGRPRSDCYVEIEGKKVARIMVVVGSNARMSFPTWQENLANARMLVNKMDEMYPGLSHGIRVKEGRYNQQYHTGALLIEIGSEENSTAEAMAGAELLANVIAEVIKDVHGSEV